MRSWNCSQNEEEEESWQERDQMAAHWDEEQKLVEGSPGQFEVMRRVPELVLHERMSHGKRVKGLKEGKKIAGRSVEDMEEELNVAEKEDSEEVKKWRGLSKSETEWKTKS